VQTRMPRASRAMCNQVAQLKFSPSLLAYFD
jgi:hypothetical protein